MRMKMGIKDILASALAAVSLVVLAFSFSLSRSPGDTSSAARRTGRILEKRIAVLEKGMLSPEDPIPSDMVIYRYLQDTLKYWNNQFPVYNDDISVRTVFPRIVDPRMNFQSPLLNIGDSLSFVSLGDKWYLALSRDDGYNKVIGGLEIMNSADNSSLNGINPRLHLGERFTVSPLSTSGGSEVCLHGTPLFKVHYDFLSGSVSADPVLFCLAFILMVVSGVLFLCSRPTAGRFCISSLILLSVMSVLYFWSRHADSSFKLFSPVLYAGGAVLTSLGSVFIINFALFLLVGSLYLVRTDVFRRIRKPSSIVLAAACDILVTAGIVVYSFFALKSIIANSNITLELFRLEDFSVWSILVYLSFLVLLLSVPLLLQMLQPSLSRIFGRHFDALGAKGRVVFSVAVSLGLVLLTSVSGFRKEKAILEVWANRLAVERDISLEMQLRSVEGMIASDMFISTFSVMNNGESAVKNIISDNYLPRLSQNYNINVSVINENTPRRRVQMINSRIRDGEPIADNSHFLYCESPTGQPRYCGIFIYISEQFGISRVLVEVEPRSGSQEKGYMSLLGISAPGRFNLPARYAYVRYKNSSLAVNKGNYPYPSEIPGDWLECQKQQQISVMNEDGYTHFFYPIAEDESVAISRPVLSPFNYLTAFVAIALVAFLLSSLLVVGRGGLFKSGTGSYKTQMNWVVMTALSLTLVTMTVVSAMYVYRRNRANLEDLMSDKVTSIRTMLQDEITSSSTGGSPMGTAPGMAGLSGPGMPGGPSGQPASPAAQPLPLPSAAPPEPSENMQIPAGRLGFGPTQMLMSPQTMTALENVGNNTNSDITLFSPDGKLAISTFTQVFERLSDGSRINRRAYEEIVLEGKRYFINKEKIGGIDCYSMYAPITGRDNRLAAIMCSPYTGGETALLEKDFLKHLFTILTLFLLLLILARFAVYRILDRMFKPLNEMGRRMNNAEISRLEHLEYRRRDEIRALVDAYNGMVDDLSESSARLAQAERDKAWSGMARQVAHEIKNPLTPMKLQLQRIIRLKQKGDPQWQDKFDEVTKVLLDHIDILSDTANSFSTYARLYTQEPVSFDLDKVLQEEIAMFDNREGLRFDYIGFEGATVSGPKPQLTRVFVNLINNAVQALEGTQDARIHVSLRHSTRDGYYDIVVEDNGPGVSEENISKLFTPNFTTKTSGSGLGLAISRNILEKCGATISYSRSFALGGACFTVVFPK